MTLAPEIASPDALLRATAAVLMARRHSGKGAVRQHRDGRWYVDFGPSHRVWSFPIGERGVRLTREMAELVLAHVQGEIGRGRDLPSVLAEFEPRYATANLVSTRLARWLEIKRREATTHDRAPLYVRELERWARPGGYFAWWEGRSIRDVSEASLEDWALWLAEQPSRRRGARPGERLAPATRARVLAGFRSFLGWLFQRRELAELPRHFPWPKVPERERRVLSIEDQEAILAAIAEADRGIFLALATLGLRPNEARALEVSDYRDGKIVIDKKACGPNVDAAVVRGTKTRYARTVPVGEELAAWIAQHVPREARLSRRRLFVLSSTGEAWSHWSLVDHWRGACRAVGVAGVSLYPGTKHTMATDAIRRGVPERSVQAMLGHQDPRSTRIYARLGDQALVQVLRRRGD
jgi:integrase